MIKMKRICHLIFRLLFLLDGGVWSLRNVSISVPRAVLSGEGQSAILRCSYDLEGAALYSIRWYRAENEFYRYVPREMPPTMVFPLPGASVDLAQSDHQQVRIVNMNRRLSGDYQCEVSADAPLFHTDIRSAPLTVVDPPFRAPQITISQRSFSRGDALRANCSVDEAYPAPNITWILDDHKIAETVSWKSTDLDFKERAAFSQIEISILEAEHYKMGITYTSSSLNRVYHDHYVYDRETDNEDRELLRYTLVPPPSGQFSLSCVATIYDIYLRKSEPIYVKEDSPQPASVTGEDSAGGVWSLRNVSISVPRAVLSGEGQSAILRCSYDLEGAALYSIRWYRAENEFYRYVPREMPPTMVFPLPGASVDLAQSDHQQVRIVNMNRRLSGDYQCEVSADAPLFHTDIRSAPLTVVDPPFRAPQITISQRSFSRGDALRANCSVDEAYPAPNITWILDDHKIAETVSWKSTDLDFKERAAFSQIEISILEAEHYKMGITYTSSSLNRVYHDHYVYDRETDNEDRELLRYTLVPPPSGQFSLSCVATIYDIYLRKSEPIYVKEDSPQPASVTGEDSAGAALLCSVGLVLLSAGLTLLQAAL